MPSAFAIISKVLPFNVRTDYFAMSLRALDVGQRIVTGGLVLAAGYLVTINTLAIYDLSHWALVRYW